MMPRAPLQPSPALHRVTLLLCKPFPAAILLLMVAVTVRRVFSAAIEADRDVGLYAVQAREWLRGGWPYVAVWDIHPLGEPALIAAAFAWFGQSVETIRMLGAVAVCASGFILGRLVARHTQDNAWGLATGLIYVAYSSISGGLAANNEVVLAPFVVGGVALTMRRASQVLRGERLRTLDALLPGLCFGVALWIKQVAAPEAMLAFACLVGLALLRGRLRFTAVPGLAIVFGLACAGPTLLTAVTYYVRGDLAEFYVATVQAPLGYGAGGRAFALVPGEVFTAATRFAPMLVLSAVAVAITCREWRNAAASDRFLPVATLFWFLAAALGTLMPPTPYGHHFLILLPPLSILTALGVFRVFQLPWLRNNGSRRLGAALLALLFVGSVPAMAAVFHIRTTPPTDLMRQVAHSVKEGLGPTEAIFVVNTNPVIYFLAGARVPGRYVFPDHLVERNAATIPGLDADAEVARILGQAPQYIVLDWGNWPTMRVPVQHMVGAALEAHYVRIATKTDGRATMEIYQRSP